MNPTEICLLLHYYAFSGDHEAAGRNAPGWQVAFDRLVSGGMLLVRAGGDTTYKITDRGLAYVEALRRVPLPVQRWVMPEGAV